MLKKFYFISIFFFILISSPYLLRYLIKTEKSEFINNIYFNYPGLITKDKKCIVYDELLKNSLDNSFSASIIDENGYLIASFNEDVLRIPASNMKLFSTAYVLNKFKKSHKFKTSLLINSYDEYFLVGEGDPDLSYLDIYKLLSNVENNKTINVNILEINKKNYWPKGWTLSDKNYEYGAPITSLAINSNQNKVNNVYQLKDNIEKYLSNKFPNSSIDINNIDKEESFYMKSTIEIDSIYSNPIISLITLANSESHNFTAESLYKSASNTWNDVKYDKLQYWLKNRGLPVSNTILADASGLSRSNRVTTKLISQFLNKMKYSKNFSIYQSSLSVIGVRGTLANRFQNSELTGKFFGKTGTLSNVFALSGYLYKNNKPLVISIIQNSEKIDIDKTFKLIKDIYHLDPCI